MAPSLFKVIIVRAWREADGLRIRLLTDGDPSRHWIVDSISDARDVLSMLLSELLGPPAGSEAPGLPPTPRAPDGGRAHAD